MIKEEIRTWAALAEIVGTVAVIISLVFVIRSIDQNTKAIEATAMDNIGAAWRESVFTTTLNDSALAETIAKARVGEPLSPGEQVQWSTYMAAKLDIWSQMYGLQESGIVSQSSWESWDNGFWVHWDRDQMASHWATNREIYSEPFRQHIDTVSKQRESEN